MSRVWSRGDGEAVEPTVGLTTRTALNETVVKFGKPPAGCLPTARHERNVALFVWWRCAACCDLVVLGSPQVPIYPSLPQKHFKVTKLHWVRVRTTAVICATLQPYNDPVKFCTSAPSSLRRSGPTGRRQLSFTTISSKTTFRSQRPPRHHYDDPAPPDAQVPLRCPGRAQTLPFAFSVGRRCAACCNSTSLFDKKLKMQLVSKN